VGIGDDFGDRVLGETDAELLEGRREIVALGRLHRERLLDRERLEEELRLRGDEGDLGEVTCEVGERQGGLHPRDSAARDDDTRFRAGI
jgi:hypothetical protein